MDVVLNVENELQSSATELQLPFLHKPKKTEKCDHLHESDAQIQLRDHLEFWSTAVELHALIRT